jgi:hypothetical protein
MNFRERSRFTGSAFHRSRFDELTLLESIDGRPTYGRSRYDRPTYEESTSKGLTLDDPTFGVSRLNGPKFGEAKSDYSNTHGRLPAAGRYYL